MCPSSANGNYWVGVFQVCLSLGSGMYKTVDHLNFTSLKIRGKFELLLDVNSSGHGTLSWETVLLTGYHYPILWYFPESLTFFSVAALKNFFQPFKTRLENDVVFYRKQHAGMLLPRDGRDSLPLQSHSSLPLEGNTWAGPQLSERSSLSQSRAKAKLGLCPVLLPSAGHREGQMPLQPPSLTGGQWK